MRVVLAKTQAGAQAAKQALSHGQSWTVVAKKYSIDPTTKNKGGQLNGVTKGQQDAALSNAAFSATVNKVIGLQKESVAWNHPLSLVHKRAWSRSARASIN